MLAPRKPHPGHPQQVEPVRAQQYSGAMAELVVEVHVPLVKSPDLQEDDYAFPWIDDVSEFVSELDETPKYDGATMYDDPEEWGEHYVFLLTGAPEDSMIRVANDLIQLPGVPVGSFAMVTDSDAATLGEGTRVELG